MPSFRFIDSLRERFTALREHLRGANKGGSDSSKRPFLELQYHPGDIRRGVRYVFLSRREVVYWSLGLALYAAFLIASLLITPVVLDNFFARRGYQAQVASRAQIGERLQTLVERLAVLEVDSELARVEMSKIYLAYGLTQNESAGEGGYPFQPPEVPDSIYAGNIRRGSELQAQIGEQLAVLKAFLGEVQTFESAHEDMVRTTPSICPLRGDDFVLTSPFGSRRSPFTRKLESHKGVDLAAPTGKPIHATADGVVTFAGKYPLKKSVGWSHYGNLVSIRNGDSFVTLFGHCDEIKVRSGQRVKQGDIIATVGDTGWSTNPHLHYEVRRLEDDGSWVPVDPRIYILDHRWRDEEQLLVRARTAPDTKDYEPLPRIMR